MKEKLKNDTFLSDTVLSEQRSTVIQNVMIYYFLCLFGLKNIQMTFLGDMIFLKLYTHLSVRKFGLKERFMFFNENTFIDMNYFTKYMHFIFHDRG